MDIYLGVKKYLAKQNIEKYSSALKLKKLYNNIIVIPAYDELENIPKLFKSLSQNSNEYLNDTLILVVVNNNESTNSEIKLKNIKLIKLIDSNLRKIYPQLNISYIDASSDGKALPDKNGGVGLSRKIGMDSALKYFNYKSNKKKILISLDADCIVSNNYLESIVKRFNTENLHSAVINYEHILPKDIKQKAAIINYEIFLRYYVLGLQFAKSKFAHHSIGSTIICDVESYIKVGGMSKKKAGEDFYFLEKLAKITDIEKISEATVFPSARISERVPFGTGPRIKRFLENNTNEYLLYSPKSFEILKKWLEIFEPQKLDFNNNLKFEEQSKNWTNEILQKAKIINSHLFNFLIEQNFEENWGNIIENSKSDEQIKRQKLNWMDGFRTLKLIHYLKDKNFPNENMFSAVKTLLNYMNVDNSFQNVEDIPSLQIQLEYLQLLRKIT